MVPGLAAPRALAVNPADDLWIAASRFIFRVSPNGDTAVVAGNGDAFFSGDGGPATNAVLDFPIGVAVDGVGGNLYVSDTFNHRVRSISPTGIITTIAGNGTASYSGDGGPAAGAELYYPVGLAVDSLGNLYIADHGNSRIRKVSNMGVITTVADATVLGVDQVWSLAIDRQDNLYVPDAVHNRILKIAPYGTLTTAAGNGSHGYAGDGGPATDAQIRLTSKAALATGSDGGLYFSDDDVQVPAPGLGPSGSFSSPRIREVSAGGIITTVAGNGSSGFSGDGGPASQAQLGSQLNYPVALATDSVGTLYIADGDNNRIRMVSKDGTPFVNLPEAQSGRWGQGLTAEKMKECRWLRPRVVGQFEFVAPRAPPIESFSLSASIPRGVPPARPIRLPPSSRIVSCRSRSLTRRESLLPGASPSKQRRWRPDGN